MWNQAQALESATSYLGELMAALKADPAKTKISMAVSHAGPSLPGIMAMIDMAPAYRERLDGLVAALEQARQGHDEEATQLAADHLQAQLLDLQSSIAGYIAEAGQPQGRMVVRLPQLGVATESILEILQKRIATICGTGVHQDVRWHGTPTQPGMLPLLRSCNAPDRIIDAANTLVAAMNRPLGEEHPQEVFVLNNFRNQLVALQVAAHLEARRSGEHLHTETLAIQKRFPAVLAGGLQGVSNKGMRLVFHSETEPISLQGSDDQPDLQSFMIAADMSPHFQQQVAETLTALLHAREEGNFENIHLEAGRLGLLLAVLAASAATFVSLAQPRGETPAATAPRLNGGSSHDVRLARRRVEAFLEIEAQAALEHRGHIPWLGTQEEPGVLPIIQMLGGQDVHIQDMSRSLVLLNEPASVLPRPAQRSLAILLSAVQVLEQRVNQGIQAALETYRQAATTLVQQGFPPALAGAAASLLGMGHDLMMDAASAQISMDDSDGQPGLESIMATVDMSPASQQWIRNQVATFLQARRDDSVEELNQAAANLDTLLENLLRSAQRVIDGAQSRGYAAAGAVPSLNNASLEHAQLAINRIQEFLAEAERTADGLHAYIPWVGTQNEPGLFPILNLLGVEDVERADIALSLLHHASTDSRRDVHELLRSLLERLQGQASALSAMLNQSTS